MFLARKLAFSGLRLLNDYFFACGVMVPNAIEASQVLRQENIFANVIEVTSPDLLN